MYQYITIDEQEANLTKEPEQYHELSYDNRNNKIFDLIDQIGSTIRKIDDDVLFVNNALNGLEREYGDDDSYTDYIEDARAVLNSANDSMKDIKQTLLKKMKENIEKYENQDENTLEAIRSLSEKIGEV